jgi:hypothetical protein
MSNETKKKLKNLPYDSMREVEAVSEALEKTAFKKLQLAVHMKRLLRDERFSSLLSRYYEPWPVSLDEDGKTKAFVTARLDPITEVVKTSINTAFLANIENKELIVPIVRSAVSSIDESYKSLLGLGFQEDSAIQALMGTLASSEDQDKPPK